MSDDLYSWDVSVPGGGWQHHHAVRDSFKECGFSTRDYFSARSGAPMSSRFTVDHTSPGAVTYWELRTGLVRFPDVIIRDTLL